MKTLQITAKLLAYFSITLLLASCASKSQNIYPDKAPRIISDYGSWTNTGGERRQNKHGAIDIEGEIGDSIIAAMDGTVTNVDDRGDMGLRVVILHGKNESADYVYTVYLHNSKNLVKVKDVVKRGEKIAEMGQCPTCHTVHLHFAVLIRKAQSGGKKHYENPHRYWLDGPYQITCYDSEREYPEKSIKLTYPVVCNK